MNDNGDNYDEIHDTWMMLCHTHRLMVRLLNKELSGYNFTREQALNLKIIKHLGDNATPYRISRFQAQEHNTVSDILNRMEKHGLVKKIRESHGKSRVTIRLTELGEQAYSKSRRKDTVDRMMSVLSKNQLSQIKSIISKLREEVLKEYEKEHKWPEIRIAPSQWAKLNLVKESAKSNPVETANSGANNRKKTTK